MFEHLSLVDARDGDEGANDRPETPDPDAGSRASTPVDGATPSASGHHKRKWSEHHLAPNKRKKGQDFWSQMDQWFHSRVTEWKFNWEASQWAQ